VAEPAFDATEPPGPPPPDRRRSPWPWVALLIALLLAGGAAAYFLTRPTKVLVPPVTGETLNNARTVLQNRGFSVNVITVASRQPTQTVIGENPVGGTKADKGSAVTLTVSSGPGPANVPSVLGDTLRRARAELRGAGLKVGPVRHQSSSTVAKGQVISTSPNAGQSVPAGSKVTLFISSGPAKVNVPDVTGEPENRAKSDLQAAGFEVSATSQTTSSTPNGDVISQSPSGNSKAAPGSTVSIVVAKAATTTQIPDVRGQAAATATSALQAAGLEVTQETKTVFHQSKNGIVLRESPSSGSRVKKGSTVTITVGQYSAPPPTTPTTGTTGPTTASSGTTGP
jgi:serine/threonine-protein kinase